MIQQQPIKQASKYRIVDQQKIFQTSEALQAVKLATPNQSTMLYTQDSPKPQRERKGQDALSSPPIQSTSATLPTLSREHPSHILQDFLLFDRKSRLKYFYMDKDTEHHTPNEDKPFKLTTG